MRFRRQNAFWLSGFCLLAIVGLCGTISASAAPTFPPLSGQVVDAANLLNATTMARLTGILRAHEERTGNQVVVATVPSLQDEEIRTYGYQLGRHWALGQADKNNGVLLLVAPQERKVAIEVGYGLEGMLTDAASKLIIENVILPQFRSGNFSGGIEAGVSAILQLLEGTTDQAQLEERYQDRGSSNDISTFELILFLIILIVIFAIVIGGGGSGGTGSRFGGSGFSSGRSSGGFSGGGGSFGGGGASGGW